MSLKAKGINAAKWSGMSTIFQIIVQLLQLILVSRLLGPTDYGLMGMVMVVVAAAVNLTDMGISNAIIHRQDVNRNHLSSLYILNLAMSAFITLIIFLSAPIVAAFYNEPRLVNPVRWMSLLCLIPAFGQQFEVLFRKELKFNNISKIQIAAYVAGFLIAFIGAYAGMGVYALVGSYLGNALVKSVGLMFLGWRTWPPTLHFARKDLKGYLSFGVYQMSSNVLQSFMSNLDYIILGRLYGAQALGYYSFAFQLCIMPVQKLSPLVSTVSLPIFAKIQDRIDELRGVYVKVVGWVSYLNAPIYLGIIVTAPVLVPFVFGEKWLPSTLIIQILSVAMLIRALILPIQPLLQAKGRADVYFRYTLIGMCVQIPGLFIGAFAGGAIGVSIAFIVIQLALFAIQYSYAVKRMVGSCLAPYLKSMLPAMVYGLIMVVGVFAVDRLFFLLMGQHANFIVQVVCGVIFYAAAIFIFNRSLIQNLRDMLIRKNKLA
ncbi:MOP flippase family protein [Paenibacillus sp. JX-17]|uniref:MOP flippase family protein n=1 Tax=Paenibacillus lacisoli TaxID=3064525 RepID=A0ABT9CGJ3_9BACL|nr:MOP flippase family protein [Paenibacillus sp. JX-17]MDO7908391.1 MOP flippase family protein [Paenibacillus sp. JX-17]